MLDALEGRIAFWLQKKIIARTFRRKLGYEGNFENPKAYQEKLQFRKLYGNHAFYASIADKYAVRNYVARRVGEKYLIPLLGVWDRLEPSIFETLPNEFVIKTNHGCKWNKVVRDKTQLDVPGTVADFNRLLRRRFGWSCGERHYNFIPPKVLIEQLLHDPDGGPPWDYNYFCYNGPAGFDYVIAMSSPDVRGTFVDKNWNIVESAVPEAEARPHLKPKNHDEMLEVARLLSADFDFVRVDLYNTAGAIYFGELTLTPTAGYAVITNKQRQFERDTMWHLDAENPKLYSQRDAMRSCPGEWPSLVSCLDPRWIRSFLRAEG